MSPSGMSSGEGLRAQNQRWGNKSQGPVLSDRTAPNAFFNQDWDTCSDMIDFEKIHLPPKIIK